MITGHQTVGNDRAGNEQAARGRRLLVVLLALAMAVSMLLTVGVSPAYAAEDSRPAPGDIHFLNIDNPELTMTDINGNQVSTKANGKPKILFFFNFGCSRCAQTETLMRQYGFDLDKVDVVFCEAWNDISEASKDEKTASDLKQQAVDFYSKLGIETTAQCYGGVKTCWEYLRACGYIDDATLKPITVYISADNKIAGFSWTYTNVYTSAACLGFDLEKGGHHWEQVSNDKSSDGYIDTYYKCAACGLERMHQVELVTPEKTNFVYNGKTQTLMSSSPVLTVTGASQKNAGTYEATVSLADTTRYVWGRGDFRESGYDGSFSPKTISWTIEKASQKPVVTTKSRSFTASALRSGSKSFALKVKGAKGTKSFTKVSGSPKLALNAKSGRVTVRKGTASGTYRIKVKVSAASTANYKAGTGSARTITVRVK